MRAAREMVQGHGRGLDLPTQSAEALLDCPTGGIANGEMQFLGLAAQCLKRSLRELLVGLGGGERQRVCIGGF